MKTVYTGGTFDLLHAGHVALLSKCRELAGPGGRVVVSVNTDEFVARYKGHEPVMSQKDRMTVLAALRDVDQVISNWGDEDSRPAIELADPDIIAIGEDWRGRDYNAQMGFNDYWLATRGIEIVYVEHLPHRSSTRLRAAARGAMETLRDDDVAAKGHPPMAEGVVLVDFDNTLYPIGRLFGSMPPYSGAAEAIQAMKDAGLTVGIFTSRLYPDWLPTVYSTEAEQRAYIGRILERDGIPFDFITAEKHPCIAMIDDKAIRFDGNWKDVLAQVLP